MLTVVAAVLKDGHLLAVCEDGTTWRLVEGTETKWEMIVERIANFR